MHLLAVALLAAAPAAPASPSMEVAAKVGLFIPGGVTQVAPSGGSRFPFPSAALSFGYRPSIAGKALRVGLEATLGRLSGGGTRQLANDPDLGTEFGFQWQMISMGVHLGIAYRLPLDLPLRISLSPTLQASAVRSSAKVTFTSGGEGGSINSWTGGGSLGLEAAMPLGPGFVLLEGRYALLRGDLGHRETYGNVVRITPAELQGTSLLAGYGIAF